MARPARETKRVSILVRFEPEELALIDAARGDVPRTVWIVGAALKATGGTLPPPPAAPKTPAAKRATPKPKVTAAPRAKGTLCGYALDGTLIYR